MDYETAKSVFLKKFARPATRRSYSYGLEVFEQFAKEAHFEIMDATASDAKNFADTVLLSRSNLDVRLCLTSCSSFFTFLVKQKIVQYNPFEAIKRRPPKQNSKKILVPTKEEVQTLIKESTPEMAAVFACMAYAGLTPLSLFSLSLNGNKFSTAIHGHVFTGIFDSVVMGYINEMFKYYDAKESLTYYSQTPFINLPQEKIENRVIYWTRKLKAEHKIQAAYSATAFRHFYAEQQFKKDKDVEELSKLLNHARVSVTMKYLKDRHLI